MFERQLGLRENPFLAGHHPKYVYPSREHQEALAHLRYGIQNREPFVLITGEVGTGKTTAVYDALGEWGPRAVVALITNSALTRSELLEEICLRFGVAAPGPLSKPQALVQLERLLSAVRARGELAILLLDEAQNLDRELLEEIRLLSNLEVQGEKLLQIFLVGQPELEGKLAQPELRQLRQRIGIHYRILPLSATETANYIHHRVAVAGGNSQEMFPAETCIEVFRVTNGIPREINIVAGQALLNAFVEDSRVVTSEHVRAVEREIEFQSVLRDQSHQLRPQTPAAPPAQAPRPEPAPRYAPPEPVREAMPAPPPSPRATEAWKPMAPPAEATPPRRAATPAPQPVAAAADDAPVLPKWFDEVVERRQKIDAGEIAPPVSAPIARTEVDVSASVAPPAPVAPPPPPPAPPTYAPAEESSPPIAFIKPSAAREAQPVEFSPPPPVVPVVPISQESAGMPERQPIEFLTARLREKLADTDSEPERKRSGSGLLVAVALLAAVAVSVVLVVRFGPWKLERRPGTTAPVKETSAPTPAPVAQAPAPEPTPPATPQKSGPVPTSTTVGAGTVAASPAMRPKPSTPVVKTATPPTTSAARPSTGAGTIANNTAGTTATKPPRPVTPPAPKKPAVVPSVFAIAVGTYLDASRAKSELTSLTESTRLPAQVVTVAEDSVSMYRVVMGSFENRATAERTASDLVRRGLVDEARVVQVARVVPTPP